MRVFVDTSAVLPFLDRDDDHHAAIVGAWGQVRAAGDTVVTSNYVLVESVALLQRRLSLSAVRDLLLNVTPLLEVVWVGEEGHDAAMDMLLRADRRDLGLVDCTSFLLMRRLGIRRALALDAHFREHGFECLPSPEEAL